MNRVRLSLFLLAGSILSAQPVAAWSKAAVPSQDVAAVSAGTLNIDAARISVAGISSGAYMAVQAQIAYPDLFPRAGILAGGPYQCAEDSAATMVQRCLNQQAPTSADISRFVATTLERSKTGVNGPIEKLKNGIVYFLHGTYDQVVIPPVAESAVAYYTLLKQQAGLTGLAITDDKSRPFGHTFPIALRPPNAPLGAPKSHPHPTFVDDCKNSISPYLGHCGIDAAKAILAHLYPEIDVQKASPSSSGTLEKVALPNSPSNAYVENWAYLYVPPVCRNNQPCGMVVALHGCNQNYTAVKMAFVNTAGFNRWAEAFRVAVLYPQTRTYAGNAGGCWDWWGYTNADYDTRKGVQLQWMANAVRQLGGAATTSSRLTP